MTRIGTWNLENFACPRDDPAAPDHQAEYGAKLDTLAAIISELEPDVLTVQEVLNPDALTDLVD